MVRSAAMLFAARGPNGTSMADVIEDSGAPRGSIYHHFPRGKEQLAEDAIRWTSEEILGYLEKAPAGPPAAVLSHFVDLWRHSVVASKGTSGCPVAGIALDTPAGRQLMSSVRIAFRSWSELLADQLSRAGVPRVRAVSIATTALAAMEGALILCRAERSSGPLEAVAAELVRLLP